MCEFKKDFSESELEPKPRLEWLDLSPRAKSTYDQHLMVAGIDAQTTEALISSEPASAFKLRQYLLELVMSRLMHGDTQYPKVKTQSEQYQFGQRAISIREENPFIFLTSDATATTPEGVELTQGLLILAKHNKASELEYNQARFKTLEAVNILLDDVKHPPFPPIEPGKRSILK